MQARGQIVKKITSPKQAHNIWLKSPFYLKQPPPDNGSNNTNGPSLTLKCWHPPCLLVLFQKEIHLPAIRPQKLLGTGGV